MFGLAVGTGGLVALSLPPFGWWPLGLLGLAGFAALLGAPATRDAFRPVRVRAAVGAGFGFGQYAIGLWWATEFHVAGYVGLIVHGMACDALAGALVPARRRWGVLFGLPAALVLADWIRNHAPAGGLPIGSASLGQAGGPLAPTLRIGGSLLLIGVSALAGAGLAVVGRTAALILRRKNPREGGRKKQSPAKATRDALSAVCGVVALAAVTALVVVARLSPDGAGPGPRQHLTVAAVQGGGPRGLRASGNDPRLVVERQLDASAALRPPLDLVVWPEDVLHLDRPVDQTPEASTLADLARGLNTTLVAGVVEDVGTDRFRNAVVAWSPAGTIVARYDKVHRVPFGEYIPARGLVKHVADLSLVPADAIAGHGPGLLLTPAGPLGVMISYEVFFDERAQAAVHAGGQVLLVPTNAASYSTSQVPTQEIAAARLRAIETGRDTIQSSPTGYSAVIDHRGRVLARTTLGRQQVLVSTVERRTGQTVYVRFGDLPVLAVAVASLAAAGLATTNRRRSSLAAAANHPTS